MNYKVLVISVTTFCLTLVTESASSEREFEKLREFSWHSNDARGLKYLKMPEGGDFGTVERNVASNYLFKITGKAMKKVEKKYKRKYPSDVVGEMSRLVWAFCIEWEDSGETIHDWWETFYNGERMKEELPELGSLKCGFVRMELVMHHVKKCFIKLHKKINSRSYSRDQKNAEKEARKRINKYFKTFDWKVSDGRDLAESKLCLGSKLYNKSDEKEAKLKCIDYHVSRIPDEQKYAFESQARYIFPRHTPAAAHSDYMGLIKQFIHSWTLSGKTIKKWWNQFRKDTIHRMLQDHLFRGHRQARHAIKMMKYVVLKMENDVRDGKFIVNNTFRKSSLE